MTLSAVLSLLPHLACPIVLGLMLVLLREKPDADPGLPMPSLREVAAPAASDPPARCSPRLGRTAPRGLCCLNSKVIAGVVIVGLGVWLVAPAATPFLLAAICPLSTLVLLRGWRGTSGEPGVVAADGPTREARRAALAAHLANVQAQQDALARALAELDATGGLADVQVGAARGGATTLPGPRSSTGGVVGMSGQAGQAMETRSAVAPGSVPTRPAVATRESW